MLPAVAIGILPVLLFLGALVMMDSYKLVTLRATLVAVAIGCASGGIAYFANTALLTASGFEDATYRRYLAPVVEESLKAAYVLFLMRSGRVGFLVDAAIDGFAVGAGFAVVENAWYAHMLGGASVALWLVRGLGTAVMHGGSTAIFAVIAKTAIDRKSLAMPVAFAIGILPAYIVHSAYNHFFLDPILSAGLIVVLVPSIMAVVFSQSERSLRKWLGIGFDTDQELLHSVNSGTIRQTNVGEYLLSLMQRFKPEDIIDMLCMLRLHLELAIQAKGMLLMREAGFDVAPDPSVEEKFQEIRALERNIGTTGRLAMLPILHTREKHLWQLRLLTGQATHK
jgi:RsiW-degrading membrane proteinase PrsW (M82 family)